MANHPIHNLFDQLITRRAAGETVAMCTVVSTRGSCPQSAGARMLVTARGDTIGTLGGGCVEAEVRRRTLDMISIKNAELLTFTLDHDYGWDDGLICGGAMDVHVDLVSDDTSIQKYRDVIAALEANESATFRLDFLRDSEPAKYVETIDPPARLLIAGAGHVGQALSRLAVDLGFDVTVIDDRADSLTVQRFPNVARQVVEDIAAELAKSPIDPQTYIVIVTRGHQRDGQALAAVANSPAKYVGLIGSKRKIKAIFDDLSQQGAPLETLNRVHAPIGFEIGAVTVSEIAISIAAELIAVRRGRGNTPARPMKIDIAQIEQWVTRSRS